MCVHKSWCVEITLATSSTAPSMVNKNDRSVDKIRIDVAVTSAATLRVLSLLGQTIFNSRSNHFHY